MILGNTQTFTAKVTNATDTTVVWAVNGVEGGSGAVGIISATGMYTAPVNLPVPETLKIAVTSLADTTKSGVSQVTIASDLQIALSTTAAAVELGATKVFVL